MHVHIYHRDHDILNPYTQEPKRPPEQKKGTKIKAFKKKRKPIKHCLQKLPETGIRLLPAALVRDRERPVKVLRIEGQNMLVINTHTHAGVCVYVVVNDGTLLEPEPRACI